MTNILLVLIAIYPLIACGPNKTLKKWNHEKAFPIEFLLHCSFPVEYESSLRSAASIWEGAVGKQLFRFSYGDCGPMLPRQDTKNIIYFFTEMWPSKSKEQGVTRAYVVENIIEETDIFINGENHHFYVSSAEPYYGAHAESLFLHELGHALGIEHINDKRSVMYPMLNELQERTILSDFDIQSLNEVLR